jgi:small conductance mechanosensitive channel
MLTAPLQVPQLPGGTDSVSVPADSLGISLDRISDEVTNTGRLILAGEWDAVFERAVQGTTDLVIGLVPSVISALFVGAIFYIVYRIVIGLAGGVLHRSRAVDEGLETISMRTLRVLGWSFIAVLVLSQLGINVAALIAGLGIAGLALGFAAKDSLENFIAGITILLDRPFSVGDWITVDGHYGKIVGISLRSTRMQTPSNQTVVFPSVHMVTKAIVNHTTGEPLRVDVSFGIAYKESIDSTRAVVMALLDTPDSRLAAGANHRVVVTELNDSSVDLELRLFVTDPGDALPVRLDFIERIRKALGEAGIEIPFPHLQLFLDEAQALRETPVRVVREPG